MSEMITDLSRWIAIAVSFICFWGSIFEAIGAIDRRQNNRLIVCTFTAIASGLALNWAVG